ncbi:MAG: ABC transporter ATP-binding protein [Planctomycetota bacterium]|jgi:ABC-type lipoprotein export system ATPase subunit
MSNNNFLLKAEDIYKSYSMGLARVEVLKGTDLSVKKGEFVSIVGASGSGKSTLLHILGALDRPDKGIVSFHGGDLNRLRARDLNNFRNKTVGFVFQFYHLLDELNVLENVLLPVMVSKGIISWFGCRKTAISRAGELLKRIGLADRVGHKPHQLSGGERQRVAIARALINEPEILLADEPTGNLDSLAGNDILNVFEKLNRSGQTIIMVTHDERIAKRAGRIVKLADGKTDKC